MKTSIAIATFLVVGTGAASVGAALPSPWKGSDTLFDLTNQVIPLSGATGTYAGGGSGGGETAMAAATPVQNTAPMSRMLASGHNIMGSEVEGAQYINRNFTVEAEPLETNSLDFIAVLV